MTLKLQTKLSDNVSHWAHLEIMVNELAIEQEEDSFST